MLKHDTKETFIHPTAIIEPGAQFDEGVRIGAYAYVGSKVKLGKNTVVQHHATVDGDTQMGEGNEVFPYAFIGGITHDKKYKGGEPGLHIGNYNAFREYVTVHVATNEGDCTTLGDNNLLLAYAHVAHDCHLANNIIMSCHSALGGHVTVEDKANIGGLVGIHQFCRIGTYAMLGFSSKVVQDVPPYMLIDGNPAEVRTYNKIALERAGFAPEEIDIVKFIYQTVYRAGLNRSQAIAALLESEHKENNFIKDFISFCEGSQRGTM